MTTKESQELDKEAYDKALLEFLMHDESRPYDWECSYLTENGAVKIKHPKRVSKYVTRMVVEVFDGKS